MGNKNALPGKSSSGPSSSWAAGLHLINAGVMTGTTVITSEVFNASNMDNVGLQIQWTGAAVGTIDVLASINNVDYYALTFSPAITQPNNNAGGYLVSLNQVPYPYFKVRYTNASSTGVLNVWLSAKDLN